MLHLTERHFLHTRFSLRRVWFVVVLLVLLVPLLLRAPVIKPLPPVSATVKRVAAPQGTQALSTPFNAPPQAPNTVSARALFALRQTEPVAPGRTRYISFYSAALGRSMDYWVYLPPMYNASRTRYPVLYMLHGLGGSSSQWKTMGLFKEADALIRNKQIAPLIIVTPQGDNGYWMNHADNGPRYGDYVINDLIPHIDQTYRTLADQRFRAIGGLSMGGHGALQLSINNPGMFSVVGAHSPVFRTQTEAFPFFGTGETYARRDPVTLVRDLGGTLPGAVWLDMGNEDPWLPRTSEFNRLLTARGIPHEWRLNPGGHQMEYWANRIPTYLKWYDQALRSGGKPPPKIVQTP